MVANRMVARRDDPAGDVARGQLLRWSAVLTVGVLLVGGVWFFVDRALGPLLARSACVAEVDGHTVRLDLEQAQHAAVIAGVAESRGLPARAATIALAAAYEESDLRSAPHRSAPAFYDALVEVEDYRALDVSVAAQKVQGSVDPDAYAAHEQDARVLTSALSGNSPEAFTCTYAADVEERSDDPLPSGLTPRAAAVLEDLEATFGKQSVGGFEPRGVSDGHMDGSAHYSGRAVDVFFRPINDGNRRRGWAVAHYLVAQAHRLDIATVIFDDRIWQAERSQAGWRNYRVPSSSSGDLQILEHRDHVHVDVYR